MSIITTALYDAIPFYIASIPIIILNMYIVSKKRKAANVKYEFTEKAFILIFILSLLFILSITIGNNMPSRFKNAGLNSINLIPFKDFYMQYLLLVKGDIYYLINLVGNMIIFVPFGFLLAVYYKEDPKEKFKIFKIAVLTTLFIETIQLFQGRVLDITDIILNTVGVLFGRLIFCYFNILFEEFFNNIHLKCLSNNKKIKELNGVQIISCLIFIGVFLLI